MDVIKEENGRRGEPIRVMGPVVCEEVDVVRPLQRTHAAVQTPRALVVHDVALGHLDLVQPIGEVVYLNL